MLQIQVLRNVKKMIVVNEFKCLVSLKASFFVFALFYKKDGISNIVKTIIIT